MRLVSTRNPKDRATFSEAIQVGMAPGGGLYVPDPIPCFRDVDHLLEMDFQSRSKEIMHRMLGDEFSREELDAVVADAFNFPVPVVKVRERIYALELFHGPTLAFKDFGARFLARMLALVSKKEGSGKVRTIITATSGDTGAAVAHAFWKLEGFRVMVLYPKGKISVLQEKQFTTLGENVHTFGVQGVFDDCQAMVKACFDDQELATKLSLTSANSINIARLLAQTLYYFEAVAQARVQNFRGTVVCAVPSGNFGNLYAGLLAQHMGLPVKFVVATNANRTVPDFLESGVYTPRPSVATLSNAMDVGAPSNWERINALYQGDVEAMRTAFRWGSLDDAATRKSMWEMNAVGYLPDPHGAVAHGVLLEKLGLNELGIFLATAHPAKFREILEQDMNLSFEMPPSLKDVMEKPILSEIIPADLAVFKAKLNA